MSSTTFRRFRTRALWACLGAMLLGACGESTKGPSAADQSAAAKEVKTVAENEDLLKARIAAQDWGAVDLARETGERALPVLDAALRSPDAETRTLTLSCLRALGGTTADSRIASALNDPDEAVRASALQLLQDHDIRAIAKPVVEALRNPDPSVRGGVAILLAKSGDATMLAPVRARLEEEKAPDVRADLTLAAARLGDAKSKQEVLDRLNAKEPRARYAAIQDIRFVGDRKLIDKVFALIDDRNPAYNVGTKDNPKYARICDAVLNLTTEWLDAKLSFSTGPYAIYTDEQVTEAKRVLGGKIGTR